MLNLISFRRVPQYLGIGQYHPSEPNQIRPPLAHGSLRYMRQKILQIAVRRSHNNQIRKDPLPWDEANSRRIPSDMESTRHAIREFPAPAFHSPFGMDRDEMARCRTQRAARQSEAPAKSSGYPGLLLAKIACGSRSLRRIA